MVEIAVTAQFELTSRVGRFGIYIFSSWGDQTSRLSRIWCQEGRERVRESRGGRVRGSRRNRFDCDTQFIVEFRASRKLERRSRSSVTAVSPPRFLAFESGRDRSDESFFGRRRRVTDRRRPRSGGLCESRCTRWWVRACAVVSPRNGFGDGRIPFRMAIDVSRASVATRTARERFARDCAMTAMSAQNTISRKWIRTTHYLDWTFLLLPTSPAPPSILHLA